MMFCLHQTNSRSSRLTSGGGSEPRKQSLHIACQRDDRLAGASPLNTPLCDQAALRQGGAVDFAAAFGNARLIAPFRSSCSPVGRF